MGCCDMAALLLRKLPAPLRPPLGRCPAVPQPTPSLLCGPATSAAPPVPEPCADPLTPRRAPLHPHLFAPQATCSLCLCVMRSCWSCPPAPTSWPSCRRGSARRQRRGAPPSLCAACCARTARSRRVGGAAWLARLAGGCRPAGHRRGLPVHVSPRASLPCSGPAPSSASHSPHPIPLPIRSRLTSRLPPLPTPSPAGRAGAGEAGAAAGA